VVEASLPKDPDRSHLADAIHFMDLIDLADDELPAARATVEQSKAAAVTAQMELDNHQQWLGRHKELYAEAVKGCERRPHDARAKVTHPHAPVTLLLAHAIELHLKAFLRLRGLGIEEVKNSFGHDFKKLAEELPREYLRYTSDGSGQLGTTQDTRSLFLRGKADNAGQA
jgi:hypothetical protein